MTSHKVVVVGGIGGTSRAILRRVGTGSVVVLGEFDQRALDREVTVLTQSGYDVVGVSLDVSDASLVDSLVGEATSRGYVTAFVHTAGVNADPKQQREPVENGSTSVL